MGSLCWGRGRGESDETLQVRVRNSLMTGKEDAQRLCGHERKRP